MKQQNKNKFSSFSIILIFIALILIGASLVPLLNIRLNPSRSAPGLTVKYSWPEASARIIEQEVTSKLEGLFSSVSQVKEISSISSKNYGRIEITFKKNVNIDAARFEIATLIRRVYPGLPLQVTYPSISLGTSGQKRRPLLTYTMNSSALPYHIQQYAEENIIQKLSAIKGVNEVNVYGSTPFEYEILADVSKLQELKISTAEVVQSVNSYFRKEIIGIGEEKLYNNSNIRQFQVRLQNKITNELKWENIPVKKTGGRIVYLSDIAQINYHEQLPNSYYRINGLNTINMVIYAEIGANNLKVATKVKEKIKEIRKNLLTGYSISLIYDATEYIAKELRIIGLRTLISVVLLLLFVLIISRQFRYLFLILLSLLANLIIAVIFYYLLKLEIHLYSLAGITVSFGIIIDNSIVMIDHLLYHRDKKIFLAVLAATLTTISSLSVIFFLEEKQRINLIDFTWVMIVNMGVSLAVALFFIPSLMEKIKLKQKKNRIFYKRKKRIIGVNRVYEKGILLTKRLKWLFITIFILGFGIPVHWLPDKIEKDTFWGGLYNNTFGKSWHKEKIAPLAEKILGGSLRLFSEHVYEGSFYANPERTTLYVRGKMPEGSTVQQLNRAIKKMENYISQFDEIEIFQTSINDYKNSSITIHFKPDYENGAFPFYLKERLTSKAISLGGLDWSIYGVGKGFNNALFSGFKNYQVLLHGYNYDQLYAYAETLKDELIKNPRIKDIEISGSVSWFFTSLYEYFLDFNQEKFTMFDISLTDYYTSLQNHIYRRPLNPVFDGKEKIPVTLVPDMTELYDIWKLDNGPADINNNTIKLSAFGNIEKRKMGNDIYKTNQQYQLVVAYDFIGPGLLAEKVTETHIKQINKLLPLGYKADSNQYDYWNRKDKKQYYLILLVILIIYFICSILLESFLQPLAIIAMIPISFIGLFLTFYVFNFNFDQGGFAAFILLSGLVVNSGLYILNDFNNYKQRVNKQDKLKLYIKAYNHKIIPVFLTIFSTILGLVPFILGGQKEVFWFAFAVGTIGGLVFSLVALILYFPLFLNLKN